MDSAYSAHRQILPVGALAALLLLALYTPADGQVCYSVVDVPRRERVAEPTVRLVQNVQPVDDDDQPAREPQQERLPEQPQPQRLRTRESTGRLTRAPAMIGDFFGRTGGLAMISSQPIVVPQIWSDGAPFDTFVTNPASGVGADFDPAVPIMIQAGQSTGQILATSIRPGIDASGDDQPDTYEISEPLNSAPMAPPGSVVVYNGGQAIYVGIPGPNTSTTAVDRSVDVGDNWNLAFSHTIVTDPVIVNIPGGGADGGIRRIKVSENNCAQPRDRFIFNYNFFNDVTGGIGDVNRYTLGFEKTFWYQQASLGVSIPFASTLANDQLVGAGRLGNTEWGNLHMILKLAGFRSDALIVSGGTAFAVPTAGDVRVALPDGRDVMQIRSEAFRVIPFLATLAAPTDRFFWQSFLSLDVDATGNSVYADATGQNLAHIGNIQDATLFFADLSLGYWLYQREFCGRAAGIASLAELHYATTIQDSDVAEGNGLVVGNFTNRFDVLNLTLGAAIMSSRGVTVRPAMVLPLSDGDDRQFDYEATVQLVVKH
jgi:hypothetical protein